MKTLFIQLILMLIRHGMTASPLLAMALETTDVTQWVTNAVGVAGLWWSARRKERAAGVSMWDAIRGKAPALLLLVALAPLVLAVANARDILITWTPPSEFEDGSPLDPATDLAEYRFYCDTVQVDTAPNTVSTYTAVDFRAQPCELHMTAVAVWGTESGMSNVVTIEGVRPRAPTILEAILAFIRRVLSWFA